MENTRKTATGKENVNMSSLASAKENVIEFHGQIVGIINLLEEVHPTPLTPNRLENALKYLTMARDELTSALETWIAEESHKIEKVQEYVSQVRDMVSNQLDKIGVGAEATTTELSDANTTTDICRQHEQVHQNGYNFNEEASIMADAAESSFNEKQDLEDCCDTESISGTILADGTGQNHRNTSLINSTNDSLTSGVHAPVFATKLKVQRKARLGTFYPTTFEPCERFDMFTSLEDGSRNQVAMTTSLPAINSASSISGDEDDETDDGFDKLNESHSQCSFSTDVC